MSETSIITSPSSIPLLLTKLEVYDEDALEGMLKDEGISKEDRNKLKEYKKNRIRPYTNIVSYQTAHDGYGRLYPTKGLSIGSFRSDLRSALLRKNYWDTDFVNCHFVIAFSICEQYGLKNTAIKAYIDDRENILKQVHSNRNTAKTIVLAIGLYGGDISLYDQYLPYSTTENPKIDALPFIRQLQFETNNLAEAIWSKHTDKHKHGKSKDKKAYKDRPNGKYALMSAIIQEEEKKCLMSWDSFLQNNGRSLDVLIHDGGCVRRLEGESIFPEELMKQGEIFILEQTGYKLTISVKPFRDGWVAPVKRNDEYGLMKLEQEREYALVGDVFFDRLHPEYPPIPLKKMKTMLENRILYEDDENGKRRKVKFLQKWLEDPERKDYKRADFIPDISNCPDDVYNLFTGFEGEKNETRVELEEIPDLIKPILYHIDILTGGYSDYFIKWLANIIQDPSIKSQVGVFFRDMGALLNEGGGTGKNLLFDWIGNKIIGSQWYVMISNNADLYGAFNGIFESKLLCVIEEASGRDNHKSADFLKAKITASTTLINRKGIDQMRIKDHTRFVFCSNNANPLPIACGDRRFTAFDVNSKHRNDTEYFNQLVNAMENVAVQKAFYLYLKSVETYKNPNQFSVNRPITEAYCNIKQLNAPSLYKWLLAKLKKGEITNASYTARELYNDYKMWCMDHERAESTISETTFGTRMKEVLNSQGSNEEYVLEEMTGSFRRTSAGVCYTIDYEKLKEGLIRLHLLNKDDVV